MAKPLMRGMSQTVFEAIYMAIVLAVLIFPRQAFCLEDHFADAGLSEQTGTYLPKDLTFRDETGLKLNLSEMIDKPTILIILYYSCSHLCPQFLEGFSESISGLRLTLGRDYRVITVSFDDRDTPEIARGVKMNYIKAINKSLPEDAWMFLTGDRENTAKLLDAVGIRAKRVGHGFVHPEVLIFLAPGGKITRYLQVSKYDYGMSYPIKFTDFELSGAIAEAAKGKVCTVGQTTPLYCFLHEPSGQKSFLAIMKIAGVFTLIMVLTLFFYLRREERLRRERIELEDRKRR